MGDEGEFWRDIKSSRDEYKQKNMEEFEEALKLLQGTEKTITKLSDYQYRFNNCLDIYPTNKKYHDLIKNKRGKIRGDIINFIKQWLK